MAGLGGHGAVVSHDGSRAPSQTGRELWGGEGCGPAGGCRPPFFPSAWRAQPGGGRTDGARSNAALRQAAWARPCADGAGGSAGSERENTHGKRYEA